MLVTGNPLQPSAQVEIITDDGETKICPSLKYPIDVDHANGDLINGEILLICGGGNDYGQVSKKCYALKDGYWENTIDLVDARKLHGASAIGNILWITGGMGENFNYDKHTELIYLVDSDFIVKDGPILPDYRYGHCQTTYQDTTLIIGMSQFKNHWPWTEEFFVKF